MKKISYQFVLIFGSFAVLFFCLSQINWLGIFKVEKITHKTEKTIGKKCWELFKKEQKVSDNPQAIAALDSIINRICKDNNIDSKNIQLHLLIKDEVNAFALPDNHLVIYSGLIDATENESQLAGVIGHELAHMQNNHVIKKLIKEIGMSALITITNTSGGGEMVKEIAKTLSSSAYDRQLEKEADIQAVNYLTNAHIDPIPFANFLSTLDSTSSKFSLSWFNTHPDSKERGRYIKAVAKEKSIKPIAILSTSTWNDLKNNVDY